MDAKEIAALADRIAEARRSRKVMDFLAAATANLSEADSYKVQFAVHDRLTANGQDRIAGWKVALTLPSQYEPMKLSRPGLRRHLSERRPPERRGVREGLADQGRHRVRDGGAHGEGRDRRQHRLHGRDDQAVRRQPLLRRRSGREPLQRRHQGERPRPHRRRRAAGGLHRRHRDQGLADARLRRRKGPLRCSRARKSARGPAPTSWAAP